MIKSLDKLLSSANCKLALCVLLVSLVLYILNRFTCSKENFMGLGNALSSRSENEYRRVKLKYGRQKLKRMGLDPGKYSEDFIFALKITLDEVKVDIRAAAKLVDTSYSPSITGAHTGDHMVDLQIKDNYRKIAGTQAGYNFVTNIPTPKVDPNWDIGGVDASGQQGKLFIETTTAQLALHNLLVFIQYQPLGNASYDKLSFYEATTLYSDPVNLLFICMWAPSQPEHTFLPIRQFPLIHGFAEKCQQKSGTSPPVGTSPSDQHQATHTNSTCLDTVGVTTNQEIATRLRDNTSVVDPEVISGTNYEGGSAYITRYANIVKLHADDIPDLQNGSGDTSYSERPRGGNLVDEVIQFSGKSIPKTAFVTTKTSVVATDFDSIGGRERVEGGDGVGSSTLNPFAVSSASALETRINELMTITGMMTKSGSEDTTGSWAGVGNNIDGKRLGCILAEIDIHSMSETFTNSNMDVVFELISKGV